MTDRAPHTSTQLDLYLDDLLTDPERVAFETRLAEDAELREHLDLQESIDQSLRCLFSPPPAARLSVPTVPGRLTAPFFLRLRKSKWTAIAAMILLVLGTWRIWHYLRGGPLESNPYPLAWQSMEMAYLQKVNTGFRPAWVCENDQQFATAFWDVLGQPMELKHLPLDIKIAGLSYANVHSRRTMLVLATERGEPIIVFADKATQPRALELSADSPLHIYSRQVGTLVLYEVSKLPSARLIDRFAEMSMPPEWIRQWEQNPKLHFPIDQSGIVH